MELWLEKCYKFIVWRITYKGGGHRVVQWEASRLTSNALAFFLASSVWLEGFSGFGREMMAREFWTDVFQLGAAVLLLVRNRKLSVTPCRCCLVTKAQVAGISVKDAHVQTPAIGGLLLKIKHVNQRIRTYFGNTLCVEAIISDTSYRNVVAFKIGKYSKRNISDIFWNPKELGLKTYVETICKWGGQTLRWWILGARQDIVIRHWKYQKYRWTYISINLLELNPELYRIFTE